MIVDVQRSVNSNASACSQGDLWRTSLQKEKYPMHKEKNEDIKETTSAIPMPSVRYVRAKVTKYRETFE
jgi:hypothetical protein